MAEKSTKPYLIRAIHEWCSDSNLTPYLSVKVDAIDKMRLMAGFQKVANRITMGLLFAALILGAAQLMRIETSFRILGYPGLAIIFFLLAAGGGVALMLSILFKDE